MQAVNFILGQSAAAAALRPVFTLMTGKLVSSLLIFLGGAGCAAAIIWLSFDPSTAESRARLRHAMRSLLFFGVLGTGVFSLAVAVLAWRNGEPLALFTNVAVEPVRTPSLAATPRSAGQTSGVAASRLTGIDLPGEAKIVADDDIVRSSLQQLRRLAEQIDSQSKLGASEVFMWRSAPQAGTTSSASRIAAVERSLQKMGWVYRRTNSPAEAGSSVREFVAVNTSLKKIVSGFWLRTDEFLLLCWGEMETTG